MHPPKNRPVNFMPVSHEGEPKLRKILHCLLGTLLYLHVTPSFAGDVPALEKSIKEWVEEFTVPTRATIGTD